MHPLDRILLWILELTHKDFMTQYNEDQKEKEVDPDIYIQAINEGATPQEAFEIAVNTEEEEN